MLPTVILITKRTEREHNKISRNTDETNKKGTRSPVYVVGTSQRQHNKSFIVLVLFGFFLSFRICWERLKAGGEGDDRGWDGWMASPTQWTQVWANSRRWWRTRKPGMLQSVKSQWVRHDWVMEQQRSYRQSSVYRDINIFRIAFCSDKSYPLIRG